MNNINLIGRIAKDLELKYIQGSGTAVLKLTLAVNRRFKKEGQPTADFFNVVVWGKIAENLAKYNSKGSQISVTGRLETRNYQGQEGNKKYLVEIVAESVDFLGGGAKKESGEQAEFEEIDEDDVPF